MRPALVKALGERGFTAQQIVEIDAIVFAARREYDRKRKASNSGGIHRIPRKPPENDLSQFNEFWLQYPLKVAKKAAEKAFFSAIKRADLQTIMAGLMRYAAATDPQFYCHAAKWLNGDRWADQVKPNGGKSHGKRETLDERCGRLLERAEELQFAEGIGREDDAFGSYSSGSGHR